MYRILFSLVLSKLNPERAHHIAFDVIRLLPTVGLAPLVRRFTRPAPALAVRTLGLDFDSPFGVAAGFDKEGKAILGLGALGFGHVEVGTLTAIPQPGNPRPRMFRLIPDRAVVNRMGFNNGGASEAARRLVRVLPRRSRPIVGVNIGKSRVVAVDDAVDDYVLSARVLAPLADYLVVNVSSPNTPGLRGLQEIESLAPLLEAVAAAVAVPDDALGRRATPLLVKIAPDLTDEQVRTIAQVVLRLGLDGIIATNTTISREGLVTDPAVVEAAGDGGVSGAPLAQRSLEILRLIRTIVPTELCVISVGGVATARDVAERLDAGATLVQGYTGFVYEGPLWARRINRGLAKLRAKA